MRLHGTFSTASRTRLVGTWTFGYWELMERGWFKWVQNFSFKADGSRTRLVGVRFGSTDDGWVLVLASGTRIVGQFRRTNAN